MFCKVFQKNVFIKELIFTPYDVDIKTTLSLKILKINASKILKPHKLLCFFENVNLNTFVIIECTFFYFSFFIKKIKNKIVRFIINENQRQAYQLIIIYLQNT